MPNQIGKPAFNLTEAQIRYAMANSSSNSGAARFLNIEYSTYKKYAKMYRDSATNKTLFELHRSTPEGTKKVRKLPRIPIKVQDILDGKIPGDQYTTLEFRKRLIKAKIIPVQCFVCGFNEQRLTDGKVPLRLDFIDGDHKNKKMENIRFLCYNHYFLFTGGSGGLNLPKEII